MASTNRVREDYYFNTSGNNYVKLNLIKSNFDAGMLTAMGAVNELPNNGVIVATNKEGALANGVFYLNVYYPGKAGKTQAAKVPVAPSKADTAFADLKGKKYRGKIIENVRVPRRRCYTV